MNWIALQCIADDLAKANQQLKRAEETSNVESDIESTPKRRRTNVPARFADMGDDSDGADGMLKRLS